MVSLFLVNSSVDIHFYSVISINIILSYIIYDELAFAINIDVQTCLHANMFKCLH